MTPAQYHAALTRYLPGYALDLATVERLYNAGVSAMGAAVWIYCHPQHKEAA